MTNYRKGYVVELRAMKDLEKEGHVCIRSSGSHSPVDIVAVKSHIARFIQVKSLKRKTKKAVTDSMIMKRFSDDILKLKTLEIGEKEIWVWHNRKWIWKGAIL